MTKILKSFSSTSKKVSDEKTPILENFAWTYLPVRIICAPVGLTKFLYKNRNAEHPGLLLKVYSLIMTIFVIYIGVYQIIRTADKEVKTSPIISSVINFLVTVSGTMAGVVNVLHSGFGSRKFCKAVNNFDDLDKRLELNEKKFYYNSRLKIIASMAFLVIFLLSYYIYEVFILEIERDERLALHFSHIMDYFTSIQLADFILTLWSHVKRFEALNVLLLKILDETPDPYKDQSDDAQVAPEKDLQIFTVQKTFNAKKDKVNREEQSNKLLELMRIFDKLADNIYYVNCNFGISLLFISISTFIYILCSMNGLILYNLIYSQNENYNRLIIIMWCVPFVILMIIGTYMAEELKIQLENLSITIDKLSILPSMDDDLQELLVCFSQMLEGRNVFITANNFFRFDYSFLFALLGAIATYTVILMQVNYDPTANKAANATNSTT